jgi:predicted DNA-binding WGR domain protein
MHKLYRRIDGVLRYHEAWVAGQEIIEHWGLVGERGETATHQLPTKVNKENAVLDVLKAASDNGYVSADEIGECALLIEYTVAGMGSAEDLKKRQTLEDRMNETLGWTGLGNCDGGSIGSGTMEVCCFVVDFEIARRVIEADLKGPGFGNFSRIYREDDD